MPSKKKNHPAKQPAPMRWEFDPDIPTHDFFEEEDALGDGLDDTVRYFVDWLEEGTFLTWEAVVCEEQELPLTAKQKKALGGLLDFNDDEDDDGILYINEIPRPSEPWYAILNKIAPHLLIEPYRTFDPHGEAECDGWDQISTALRENGQGLSLPPGVESPEEVVPAALRHKLWLQFCFNNLSGFGQSEELTLENPEEIGQVDSFIENLRECKDSVAYFGLTLDSLMTKLILPERDQPIFFRLMLEKMGLGSAQEKIADHL
jgi:hypothetical protein